MNNELWAGKSAGLLIIFDFCKLEA